jgi:hypothetical protein
MFHELAKYIEMNESYSKTEMNLSIMSDRINPAHGSISYKPV